MPLRSLGLATAPALVFSLLAACAAVPGSRSAKEVETAGMAKSFAGANKCNPKSADRPFILEWDATDMSSFQARAASDVLFVRYEGCDLKVIDACSIDALKGTFGTYRPVEWTGGSLETLDINDEGDLYAKLPLGAATLGARVEGGEKFHMEYFVSGTRTATRSAISRADLAKVPACKAATHFVYAYNLGAFALGAQSSLKGGLGGSAFGFGAGVDRSHSSKAEKQGGDLASCKGKSAKELDTCKVPIRLTLREIDDADGATAAAPEGPAPVTTGALADMKLTNDRERKAAAFYESAHKKANARDGKACLADLDQHDKLDPRPEYLSTTPKFAITRMQCLMLSGQCPAGKVLARKMVEEYNNSDAAMVDRAVEGYVASYCQGGQGAGMSPRDELLKAKDDLARGANQKKTDAASCRAAFQTVQRLLPTVKPEDEHDQVTLASEYYGVWAAGCFARAGDCDAAWKALSSAPPVLSGNKLEQEILKQNLGAYTNNLCKK